MSTKAKILALLKANVCKSVSRARIIRAAGASEWARRVRDLRHEGWRIDTVKSGYRLTTLKKARSRDVAPINAKLRYAILHRDGSRCRRCGRTPEDGVKLVVDHIVPRAWGGKTTEGNLWTLCEQCNLGKKHHESDKDAGTMKRILGLKSGKARLLAYLQSRPRQLVTAQELRIVARIHEHARRIRELRAEGWDVVSHLEDKRLKPGDYILRSLRKRGR